MRILTGLTKGTPRTGAYWAFHQIPILFAHTRLTLLFYNHRFESYYVHPSNEDYEGSRHGAADSTRTSKAPDDSTDSWKAPTANQMDLMERGDLNPNSPDATASAAKGAARAARMVEMPVRSVFYQIPRLHGLPIQD